MKEEDMKKAMAQYGYELFSDEAQYDFARLLLDASISSAQRVTEGIPVIITNHLRRNGYDKFEKDTLKLFNQVRGYPRSLQRLKRICLFYSITAALLEKELMLEEEAKKIRNLIAHSLPDRRLIEEWTELLRDNNPIQQAGLFLDPERLKKTFRLYTVPKREEESLIEKSAARRQISLEYNLSQLFPLKQKEIIKKKIKGEKMTKTEREYFSRVIKGKITAIVDPDLKDFLIQALK